MAFFNVTLKNAKIYNVTRIDVVIGEVIKVDLLDVTEPVEWISSNDPVLFINQAGESATINAEAKGTSKIYIVNASFTKIIELAIRVVDEINADAVDLGVKVEPPVLK